MADIAMKGRSGCHVNNTGDAGGVKLAKPAMRGLLVGSLKFGLAFAFVCSSSVALYWKVFHMDYRQRKTKEYYATYDPVKEYERIRDLGLFQWAKPAPGAKPIYKFHEDEPSDCSKPAEIIVESEVPNRKRCLQYEDGSKDE